MNHLPLLKTHNTDDSESPHSIKAPKNNDNFHSKDDKITTKWCGDLCRWLRVPSDQIGHSETIQDIPNINHLLKLERNNGEDNHAQDKDTNIPNHLKLERNNGEDGGHVKTSTMTHDLKTNSRDELLNKVSNVEELENILIKFRTFKDYDTSSITSTTSNTSIDKVNTIPTRSYAVSYSWEPQDKITNEKYSILMLKFTDAFGNIIRNKDIDYNIMVRDNNSNIIFQKQGYTPTGLDLKIIDENTFPIGGSLLKPAMYNIQIDVNGVDGKLISEHAFLPAVAVISEKT